MGRRYGGGANLMAGDSSAASLEGANVPGVSYGYEAFKVEQHGIDLIPESDRKATAGSLFWMWAGAVWNVEYLVYGALIVSFGLSFQQAVLAIIIGNLSYAFLGMASLQGPLTGTTAFVVSRAPFGLNGNRSVAFFNWITQVGFEIEGLVLIVLVVEALFSKSGATIGTGLKVIIILGAVALQFLMPLFGHATIAKILRYLAILFVVVFAIMAALVVPHVNLSHLHQSANFGAWTTALVLLIAAGGLGWTENGNDYSRYLPTKSSKAATFWAAALGTAIPSIVLELLGAAAYVVSPKVTSITGIPSSFATWFFWPFLILAIVQLLCINTFDLYSSGVTLQAIGVPVKRWGAVIIDTVVTAIVTFLVIFNGKFYADLSGFLSYIVVWLAPWFAIMAADYLLRKGRYDPASLARRVGGIYYHNGGVRWSAIIAQALGMIATMLWINAQFFVPSYMGLISSKTGGSDFSWLIGIVVGGLAYYLLARSEVRSEAAQPLGA